MYLFYADHRCDKCGKCEEYIHDFIAKYDGHGLISEFHLRDEEIQDWMDKAILSCPCGALHLARLKDE